MSADERSLPENGESTLENKNYEYAVKDGGIPNADGNGAETYDSNVENQEVQMGEDGEAPAEFYRPADPPRRTPADIQATKEQLRQHFEYIYDSLESILYRRGLINLSLQELYDYFYAYADEITSLLVASAGIVNFNNQMTASLTNILSSADEPYIPQVVAYIMNYPSVTVFTSLLDSEVLDELIAQAKSAFMKYQQPYNRLAERRKAPPGDSYRNTHTDPYRNAYKNEHSGYYANNGNHSNNGSASTGAPAAPPYEERPTSFTNYPRPNPSSGPRHISSPAQISSPPSQATWQDQPPPHPSANQASSPAPTPGAKMMSYHQHHRHHIANRGGSGAPSSLPPYHSATPPHAPPSFHQSQMTRGVSSNHNSPTKKMHPGNTYPKDPPRYPSPGFPSTPQPMQSPPPQQQPPLQPQRSTPTAPAGGLGDKRILHHHHHHLNFRPPSAVPPQQSQPPLPASPAGAGPSSHNTPSSMGQRTPGTEPAVPSRPATVMGKGMPILHHHHHHHHHLAFHKGPPPPLQPPREASPNSSLTRAAPPSSIDPTDSDLSPKNKDSNQLNALKAFLSQNSLDVSGEVKEEKAPRQKRPSNATGSVPQPRTQNPTNGGSPHLRSPLTDGQASSGTEHDRRDYRGQVNHNTRPHEDSGNQQHSHSNRAKDDNRDSSYRPAQRRGSRGGYQGEGRGRGRGNRGQF